MKILKTSDFYNTVPQEHLTRNMQTKGSKDPKLVDTSLVRELDSCPVSE